MSNPKSANQTASASQNVCNPILTCDGVNRKQAFRRGSHLIGYGDTVDAAIENLITKEVA